MVHPVVTHSAEETGTGEIKVFRQGVNYYAFQPARASKPMTVIEKLKTQALN